MVTSPFCVCLNTPRLISVPSERVDRRRGGPEAAGGRHRAESSRPRSLRADRPGLPPGTGFRVPDVSTQASRGEAPTQARFCPSSLVIGQIRRDLWSVFVFQSTAAERQPLLSS